MDARLAHAAILAAVVLSAGAGRPYYSARSQHFIVTAPTAQLAQEVSAAAEAYRRDLAIEWLGHELPEWRDICPITVKLDPGAGGATSFIFQGGFPTQWTMQIQGTRERILDSVLPHEITHTIFATHFGRPLPRWADEGGSTTVEHASEKTKQDNLLIRFLTTDRGIAFNDMYKMKEYPRDILPLYSQGYSLARYFIEQGGKRKFVEYVGEGMATNNWTATTRKYYGFNSLSDLQVTWVDWVRKGSPALDGTSAIASSVARTSASGSDVANTQMASLTRQPQSRVPDGALSSWQTAQSQNARAMARANQSEGPPIPDRFAAESLTAAQAATGFSTASRPVSDGWYAKRRDQAQAALGSTAGAPAVADPTPAPTVTPLTAEPSRQGWASPNNNIPAPPTREARNQPASPDRRVLMEWTRPADQLYQPGSPSRELSGLAIADPTTRLR
jgi:hypothetical protein